MQAYRRRMHGGLRYANPPYVTPWHFHAAGQRVHTKDLRSQINLGNT